MTRPGQRLTFLSGVGGHKKLKSRRNMAKTKGPLLSSDAHGSLGRVLTYSHRKSGKQVRTYNKPLVAPSAKQRGQRRLTEFLVAQWQNMSDADKATWETNAKASGLNLPGYHYFLREAQRDLYTHHGLCGYWSLNEYVNGKVKDLSGQGNDGTPHPSYPTNAPTLIDSGIPRFSNALDFDGVDEYINCAHNSIFNWGTGDFTICFRMWQDTVQAFTQVITKSKWVSTHQGVVFELASKGSLSFLVGDGTTRKELSGKVIKNATWIDIVGRRLSGVIELFQDNTSLGTLADATQDINNIGLVGFACRETGVLLSKVKLDEISMYNRALSNAELTTRFKFSQREVS